MSTCFYRLPLMWLRREIFFRGRELGSWIAAGAEAVAADNAADSAGDEVERSIFGKVPQK